MSELTAELNHLSQDSDVQALLARLITLWPSRAVPALNYSTVLTLAIAVAPSSEWALWDEITSRTQNRPQDNELLDQIVRGVYAYYRDQIAPRLIFRIPTPAERAVLLDLVQTLRQIDHDLDTLTWHTYEVGKRHYVQAELRQFFQMVYEVLLGQPSGPRLPVFIHLHGIDSFCDLVEASLARKYPHGDD